MGAGRRAELTQQSVVKSPVSVGRGHSQLTGPKLNSEALGTMSSHLRLETGCQSQNGRAESGAGGFCKQDPRQGPGPMPKVRHGPQDMLSQEGASPVNWLD